MRRSMKAWHPKKMNEKELDKFRRRVGLLQQMYPVMSQGQRELLDMIGSTALDIILINNNTK